MPERTFSAARLRGYRVLEEEGIGDAGSLLLLNALASARLWLPLSLIEIAFRNAVDGTITAVHPDGEAWLCEPQDAGFDWRRARGKAIFRRSEAVAAGTPEAELDDSPNDPVAVASIMAARHGREMVTRDDVVSHLMLGFWVFRCPNGLVNGEPEIDLYELLSAHYQGALGDSAQLRELMTSEVLLTRNLVAHNEPMVIRARHIFHRKTLEARRGHDLVVSVQAAILKFHRLADTIIETARTMAPMASDELDATKEQLHHHTADVLDRLEQISANLAVEREARRAARREAWARDHPEEGGA